MSGRDVPLLAPEEAAGAPFQGRFVSRHFLAWVHPLLQRCGGAGAREMEASYGLVHGCPLGRESYTSRVDQILG